MTDGTLVKSQPSAPDGYPAEAAGLDWLRVAGGARIVRVVAVSTERIELERVESHQPTPAAAHSFGAALAVTHGAGADAFGSPPTGWSGPLYIGRREMPSAAERSWGRFYARDRVLPFLRVAEAVGSVSSTESALVQHVCDAISDGAFDDDDERPARLHGDLWAGNVLWDATGVVLIDPAAHGGHRETDLAMLDLFGCPFLAEVLSGYESEHALRAGWRERIPLHQLHPLAVHAAGHGRSYGVALARAAEAVAELLA